MEGPIRVLDDPAAESLEAEITEVWGHINAATWRFLSLIARYDREGGWQRHGLARCADWLNWQCGIGPVAAREKLRVAHAIEQLPKISAAFRCGQLSYSKVRALTRVAKPETEDDLLNVALHGTAAHVERLVRKYRRVQRIEAAQEAQAVHESRRADWFYDDDGALVIHARLSPEVGARVRRGLEAALELSVNPAHTAAGEDVSAETIAARRADALAELAESYLEIASRSDDEGRRSTADRFQVVVHVDAQIGEAEIEHGPAIAEESARRICCDASVIAMSNDAQGNPLNAGRRTRAISPAMRRALYSRDRGCRYPGCTHTRFTDGHHIRHWADGGETKLSNLVSLCSFHHRLVHEGGCTVRHTDDGAFVFANARGKRIPAAGQ
jgi:Domain of unknown function (DUF222)/HNH endonuclease